MKNFLFIASFFCIIVFTFTACKKDKALDTLYGINPSSEVDMTNAALRINGQLIKGALPSPTSTGANALSMSNSFSAFEVSAGTLLAFPISTSNDSIICSVNLQVEGSDSYWQVPIQRDTFGELSINIFVPNFVKNNNFTLLFAVSDCNGNVSPYKSTKIIITDTPTLIQGAQGTPRFNLQFTNGLDFDLHVLTPNGNEIYYHNKSADNGNLDVDCICCDDPDENIYWEPGTATKGKYVYWVEFYGTCSESSGSYILRVLNNTTVQQMHTGTLNYHTNYDHMADSSHHYTFTLQ